MLTTPFSECVVLVHLPGQWHHKSQTHMRLVQSLLSELVDFEQEFRILGRFFFTLLGWPCKKGWDACGANGVMDRMARQVKVEALLKVVHSVTHAVPKVDRRKMLRRTGECDVCTANGVGCLDRCSGQRRLKGNGVKMGDAQHCLVFAPTLIKKSVWPISPLIRVCFWI